MTYYRTQFKTTGNLTLHYGYLCSWTCIYMCRQLVFPWGILCVRYLFFLLKKKNHTLCFYCIINTPYYPITWLFLLLEHSTHPALLLTLKLLVKVPLS